MDNITRLRHIMTYFDLPETKRVCKYEDKVLKAITKIEKKELRLAEAKGKGER